MSLMLELLEADDADVAEENNGVVLPEIPEETVVEEDKGVVLPEITEALVVEEVKGVVLSEIPEEVVEDDVWEVVVEVEVGKVEIENGVVLNETPAVEEVVVMVVNGVVRLVVSLADAWLSFPGTMGSGVFRVEEGVVVWDEIRVVVVVVVVGDDIAEGIVFEDIGWVLFLTTGPVVVVVNVLITVDPVVYEELLRAVDFSTICEVVSDAAWDGPVFDTANGRRQKPAG